MLALLFRYSSAQEQHHLKVQWSICVNINEWEAKHPLDFTQAVERPGAKV